MAKRAKNKPAAQGSVERHPLEHFVTRDINRRAIKTADYNPRFISEDQRQKLKATLSSLGLLEPLVWNRRSADKGWPDGSEGCLVGGHQRLKVLDGLANGAKDYILTVAEVDLSESEEVEANIALNNQQAAGQYDPTKLAKLLKRPDIRVEATGFDKADVFRMFGSNPDGDDLNVAVAAEKLQKMRDAQAKARAKDDDNTGDGFYIVLTFQTPERADALFRELRMATCPKGGDHRDMQWGEVNRYQPGEQFVKLLRSGKRNDGAALDLQRLPDYDDWPAYCARVDAEWRAVCEAAQAAEEKAAAE